MSARIAPLSILARAKHLWDEREATFPPYTRPGWDYGSHEARLIMMTEAEDQLMAAAGMPARLRL